MRGSTGGAVGGWEAKECLPIFQGRETDRHKLAVKVEALALAPLSEVGWDGLGGGWGVGQQLVHRVILAQQHLIYLRMGRMGAWGG